ncbi:MAG TPA: polyribonucleotide nucleotidyltransferase [Flavobacteriales bacterium]|nr:polyribonucleotide nucleotidyltransferase [Flavobacteriales bacterium]HIO16185.1 polyribonucleotide nucleotidyltransferase [Flavobacteriales bacterium]
MNYTVHNQTIDLGNGREITLETGKLAKQADGAIVLRSGKTMLLATIVSSKEARAEVDFLPLTVDYREKYAAAGKFPGGFFKREARPSDSEVLVMRLVDRALRPMFPSDYHAGTQVMVQLMSADDEVLPDSLVGLAASACIAVSDVPFNGPISEVRVARIDGKFVINPNRTELETADMDMMIAGTIDSIVMVEGEMSEVSEDEMVDAIIAGAKAITTQCEAQIALAKAVGKYEVSREYCHEEHDEDLKAKVFDTLYAPMFKAAQKGASKSERKASFKQLASDFVATLSEEESSKSYMLKEYLHDVQKKAIRDLVLIDGVRLDGRSTTDIRDIWGEVDYLPSCHGSAIFTRGETQALTTLTLGTKQDEQLIDGALVRKTEKFLLHYNFPPFSTGEERPLRGTSRREVGHGNLALRALKHVLPPVEDCPYTIRLVSEILESNGSSSMATVCAGTLALMDGGIPITAPVSGIAMGLITDKESGKYAILSDILGDEDHLGDMDFKITGTADGITACQMDMKIQGISMDVLREALNQACDGRHHIRKEMLKVIAEPRDDFKPHAPRIVAFNVPGDAIGAIIGPGGKIIQELQADTNTNISIEDVDGQGRVEVAASDKAAIDDAVARIKAIAFPPTVEIGEEYEGKVKTIMPYGAFVEVLPGIDGLLHVSELEWRRVDDVNDILKEGEKVKFKVVGRDPKTGKIKLSRKALLEKPEGYVEAADRPRRDRGDRGGDRRNDRRDGGERRERRD